MSKQILKIKMKCSTASKSARGSSIQFAKNIEQTKEGAAAREVAVFNILDLKVADSVEPIDAKGGGKDYEITITEL